MHFFEKNGFLILKIASNRKVVKKLFVWGIITYLFVKKKNWSTLEEKMSNQFFYFDPHIFGQISSILVIKQVLYNIF